MRESPHIILGVTGASGAPYARRLLDCLARQPLHVHLVVSPPGREVLAAELGVRSRTVRDILGRDADNVTLYSPRNIGARIASGSFLTRGMVVCPCSAHTLGAVASGLADNLITRAAMVTLKESRRLVLVPREMPLGAIELENMLRASRGGAIICPACPGFYANPRTVDDLVDFVVARVLDLLGVPHALDTRWKPEESARGRSAEVTEE